MARFALAFAFLIASICAACEPETAPATPSKSPAMRTNAAKTQGGAGAGGVGGVASLPPVVSEQAE